MGLLWKRILLWGSLAIILSMIASYIVLSIKFKVKDVIKGEFYMPYTCFETCLSQEEEKHAQKLIEKCQNKECKEIRIMLQENNCDDIKNWYSLNKQKVT